MFGELKDNQEEPALRKKQFLKMGLLFCCAAIVSDLIVWYLSRHEYLAFMDIFTSFVLTNLGHLSGLKILRDSNTIYLAHSEWVVATECTGIFIMTIFWSFIAVYPASIKAKAIGLLTGIPLIFFANVVRLLMMAWIDYLDPKYTKYFHDYVWQVFFIIMIVFMWMIWIDKVVTRESKISVPS